MSPSMSCTLAHLRYYVATRHVPQSDWTVPNGTIVIPIGHIAKRDLIR